VLSASLSHFCSNWVDVLSDAEMKKLAEEHLARDGNPRPNGHDKNKRDKE
jgi:hypothetical protein